MKVYRTPVLWVVTRTVFALGCVVVPALGLGCSFDPLKYFSQNTCEILNCDGLFFIEDLFPLSAEPMGESESGGEMDMEGDDDGGHL